MVFSLDNPEDLALIRYGVLRVQTFTGETWSDQYRYAFTRYGWMTNIERHYYMWQRRVLVDWNVAGVAWTCYLA